MKILWHSAPSFFKTGYGVQTHGFVKQLQALGHEVAVVNAITQQDLPGLMWDGIMHYPGGEIPFGVKGAVEWTRILKPDLVITLFDIWTFPTDLGDRIKQFGANWMPIVPIDCEPVHEYTLRVLKSAQYPCAMSKFGVQEMKNHGFKPFYLPHGIDTDVFKPVEPDKKLVGAEGKFVVGCVAANKEKFDRKGLLPTLQAFSRFQKKHKDTVFYYHGEITRVEDGLDLEWLAHELGVKLHVADRWHRWAYFPPEEMALLYSTFDVFMLLTKGEGFCIPLIESQACGTPVIVTDYTAPKDLVGAGWKIPITHKVPTIIRGYWGEPNVDKAVEALEEAYQMWKDGKDMRQQAREFALDYDYKVVTNKYLVPILKEIENGTVWSKVRGSKDSKPRRRRRKSGVRTAAQASGQPQGQG